MGSAGKELSRVSYHAVTRYCQRMLGVDVAVDESQNAKAIAVAHCNAAGLTLHSAQKLLLPPPVLSAILAGFSTFRTAGIDYFVKEGVIVTVTRAAPYPQQKLKILDKTELRRRMAQVHRRRRKHFRMKDRIDD